MIAAIPALKGTIARRILVNFRAEPGVVAGILPQPFRPKLHDGWAIAGVCLIRLENIRPACSPVRCGLSSENAAHRIAVLWEDESGETREGVLIPRRDTGSLLTLATGGRVFPGQHHPASFDVHESGDQVDFSMRSQDHTVEIRLVGKVSGSLPATSCFGSLAEASAFLEGGCLGYSVRCDSNRLDGLMLKIPDWHVEALDVSTVRVSYFEDEQQFPRSSVVFDHALLMRNTEHEWHAAQDILSGERPMRNADLTD